MFFASRAKRRWKTRDRKGCRERPRNPRAPRGGWGLAQGRGMTGCAWPSPPHTPRALPPHCPGRSALSKAPRRVLSSVKDFCNMRGVLSCPRLPDGYSHRGDGFLLSGNHVASTCLERVEEVPASRLLSTFPLFCPKLLNIQGALLVKTSQDLRTEPVFTCSDPEDVKYASATDSSDQRAHISLRFHQVEEKLLRSS